MCATTVIIINPLVQKKKYSTTIIYIYRFEFMQFKKYMFKALCDQTIIFKVIKKNENIKKINMIIKRDINLNNKRKLRFIDT